MIIPRSFTDMVGKTMKFSGGLFSSKKPLETPQEYLVMGCRWGESYITSIKDGKFERKHPTIELLVNTGEKNRWTKPFPCREYVYGGNEDWILNPKLTDEDREYLTPKEKDNANT